jgi:hypothetical protein
MNCNKYHFNDFTHSHYKDLILQAKLKFNFILFDQAIDAKEHSILWRHDIDFSISDALELARIENSFDIKSTYFLLLHSDYYNPLEHSSTSIAKEIISLGHDIGIHYDFDYYSNYSIEDFESNLKSESLILENALGTKIKAFSFHNPSDNALSYTKLHYSGLINAYSRELKEKFDYCSDSNGYWRYERMWDIINSDKNFIQALTHPVWWTENVMSPKEKIWNCIDKRCINNKEMYQKAINSYGRILIDWD